MQQPSINAAVPDLGQYQPRKLYGNKFPIDDRKDISQPYKLTGKWKLIKEPLVPIPLRPEEHAVSPGGKKYEKGQLPVPILLPLSQQPSETLPTAVQMVKASIVPGDTFTDVTLYLSLRKQYESPSMLAEKEKKSTESLGKKMATKNVEKMDWKKVMADAKMVENQRDMSDERIELRKVVNVPNDVTYWDHPIRDYTYFRNKLLPYLRRHKLLVKDKATSQWTTGPLYSPEIPQEVVDEQWDYCDAMIQLFPLALTPEQSFERDLLRYGEIDPSSELLHPERNKKPVMGFPKMNKRQDFAPREAIIADLKKTTLGYDKRFKSRGPREAHKIAVMREWEASVKSQWKQANEEAMEALGLELPEDKLARERQERMSEMSELELEKFLALEARIEEFNVMKQPRLNEDGSFYVKRKNKSKTLNRS